jgi:Ca-activated chloride channel homolog
MKYLILCLVCLYAATTMAQITSEQQKGLNAYVEYANASAEEITHIVTGLINYYPTLERKNQGYARYVCPYQLDSYFIENIQSKSKALKPEIHAPIAAAFNDLVSIAEQIDQNCKALDTYHKLEDYKKDQFAEARRLIEKMTELITDYKNKQAKLQSSLEMAYKKLSPKPALPAYESTRQKMLNAIIAEQLILNKWQVNLETKIHTGWPFEEVQNSILVAQKQVNEFQSQKPQLNYPASTTWGQFTEGLEDMVRIKQNGIDGYNIEAKKSDEHSNAVYLDLINYYNGTLISFYNNLINFSERDGYRGLRMIQYVPSLAIRKDVKVVAIDIKPFEDITSTGLQLKKQAIPIPKNVFNSLSTYADYINETWRQTNYLQSVLTNFNSSVNSFKATENFERRASMNFDFPDYKIPLSAFQEVISKSRDLRPDISKSLNDQAQVLLNILKELNELCAFTEQHVKERQYEKDHLRKLSDILKREADLLQIWDQRKELLYADVRKVFDSYVLSQPSTAWSVSGRALQMLVDLDHDALFEAKKFYKGDSSIRISTVQIDEKLREVIANEYQNMKGIEKYGRNNGLCPYTPYEDIPQASKQLSEHFQALKPVTNSSRYNHPYYNMVYLYNEVADDFNKFCELSTSVPHLKTIKQPELFIVKEGNSIPKKTSSTAPEQSKPATDVAITSSEKPETRLKESTAKSTHTVERDTIYIEKRDTVYIREPNEDLRSMDGYATNNLILLLDVSGSMNQPEKLPLLKASILELLTMMREEDKISIIAFSGKPKILLRSTSFKDEKKIQKAINDLISSGKTDGNAAIELAYKVADENYIRGGNNRIVFATDGEFTLSPDVKSLIEKFAEADIFFSAFNFGKGMGSSRSLESLAILGKGNYSFISKQNVDLTLIREVKAKRKR